MRWGPRLVITWGYASGAVRAEDVNNQRNSTSGQTVLTDDGPLRLEIPRDRDASSAPILIPKHERRFADFTIRSSRCAPAA